MGVVKLAWACPKLSQKVSQLHFTNEWSCKVRFLHVVRDPEKLQICPIISSGCGQACLK